MVILPLCVMFVLLCIARVANSFYVKWLTIILSEFLFGIYHSLTFVYCTDN